MGRGSASGFAGGVLEGARVVVAFDGGGEAFDGEGVGGGEVFVEGAFVRVLELHQDAVVGPARGLGRAGGVCRFGRR